MCTPRNKKPTPSKASHNRSATPNKLPTCQGPNFVGHHKTTYTIHLVPRRIPQMSSRLCFACSPPRWTNFLRIRKTSRGAHWSRGTAVLSTYECLPFDLFHKPMKVCAVSDSAAAVVSAPTLSCSTSPLTKRDRFGSRSTVI